jgi:1,2-phenylacetyl-CoA epoxidase catalytic subunit
VNGKDFVAGLLEEMGRLFARLGETETLEAESEGKLAGYWLPSTPEVDAKLALAQQCGDEMKHYALISQRLVELGEDLTDFDPLADGHTPLYQYLRGLRTTVERIAAGPFASEAIAEIRNAQFVQFCQSVGDEETARLYADTIQPEEVHHHHLGRDILIKYATTPDLQELAAAAVRNTLAIADELRNLAGKTTGIYNIPVS